MSDFLKSPIANERHLFICKHASFVGVKKGTIVAAALSFVVGAVLKEKA